MIAYSGTTISHQEIDNGTQAATMAGLRDMLVLSGWTLVSSVGGYTLLSVTSPRRQSVKVKITAESGTLVGVQFISVDDVVTLNKNYLASSTGRRLLVTCNGYQLFTRLSLGWITPGTSVMGGIPYIHDHHAPVNIASIVAGTPLRIVTSVAHGLITGNSAFVGGLLGTGLSGVNTNWTVTVINSTTIDLVGSSFNSAVMTPGTGVVAGPRQIGRLIWSMADSSDGSSYRTSFRTTCTPDNNATVYQSHSLNQNTWNININNKPGRMQILVPPSGVRWYNNQFFNFDPYLLSCGPSPDGLPTVNAQIWDAVAVNTGLNGDLPTSFDGHSWSNYTGPYPNVTQGASLVLAVS